MVLASRVCWFLVAFWGLNCDRCAAGVCFYFQAGTRRRDCIYFSVKIINSSAFDDGEES